MALYRLTREPVFPDPGLAEPDGLLAVGGDLSPERLVAAYAAGIFPWYSDDLPILWWSPDPRLVLFPEELHLSRSPRRTLRSGRFLVRSDTAFEQVIDRCAGRARPGQEGTWITPEMAEAYLRLHRLGLAHSIEAWEGGALAGGLYGVALGAAFFGESMFADRPDASKVALARLVEWLRSHRFEMVDCQVRTEHLVRLGGRRAARSSAGARIFTAVWATTARRIG